MVSPVVVEINTCKAPGRLSRCTRASWESAACLCRVAVRAKRLQLALGRVQREERQRAFGRAGVCGCAHPVHRRAAVPPPNPSADALVLSQRVPPACRDTSAARATCAARVRRRSPPELLPAVGARPSPVPRLQLGVLDFSGAAELWFARPRQPRGAGAWSRARARACSTSAKAASRSGRKPSSTTLQCAAGPEAPPLEERCIATQQAQPPGGSSRAPLHTRACETSILR